MSKTVQKAAKKHKNALFFEILVHCTYSILNLSLLLKCCKFDVVKLYILATFVLYGIIYYVD